MLLYIKCIPATVRYGKRLSTTYEGHKYTVDCCGRQDVTFDVWRLVARVARDHLSALPEFWDFTSTKDGILVFITCETRMEHALRAWVE